MLIREAILADIAPMHAVRTSVTENMLSHPNLISAQEYEEYISKRGKGWVCEMNNEIIGFAVADLQENNVWALFVLPDLEKKGVGKQLHQQMLNWYFSQTNKNIWLSTTPGTRADGFYRKFGWQPCGIYGKGETKFEMSFETWVRISEI